jgi:septal ring factor EnvC (AmiA/AmiB activator)
MEDAPVVFERLRRVLHEYNQTTEAARAAQAERERLLQQYDALREQFRQLHAELVRFEKERADAAEWFVAMMLEAAARFPTTPPPA